VGYEIVNDGQATPHRLHDTLRLVARLEAPTRAIMGQLLQPPSINPNQVAFETVFSAGVGVGLFEDGGKGGVVTLAVRADQIEDPEAYRSYMRSTLLGVTAEDDANYRFNIYTAWYAAQDADVFRMDATDLYAKFNESVYPNAEERQFNATKLAAWRRWAAFLGLGWVLRAGNSRTLIPDARERIRSVLPNIFGDAGELAMAACISRLGETCPELDGGALFFRAWQASHPGARGNDVSLMTSTGLRALHDEGTIRLVHVADAGDSWSLFPAEGSSFGSEVTHIVRGGVS